jgi:ferredoxin/coenzyme F420-reducing hydrogenase delta subunit
MDSAGPALPFAPLDPDPQHAAARALRAADRALDRLCGMAGNPLRQLGALAMLCFWISAGSGAYLYIYFDTAAVGALRSVQALQQHPLNGLVHSLHRYSSFAFLATMLLHLAYEWIKGRYRGFRWFSWLTGVPLIWLAVACGMVGYWLVADTRAQFVAAGLGEWLGAVPGVGASLMRNFITEAAISDRLFSLLVFLHIGVGLLLLLGVWVHLARLVRPCTQPQRRVAACFALALLALCVLLPALAIAPADFSRVPQPVPVDWLVFGVLPLMHATSPASAWVVVGALTLLLAVLPWTVRIGAARSSLQPTPQPAQVDPANCNGCRRCFDDCPYGAVLMVPHPDRRLREMAQVTADQCAGCGICVGACPSSSPFRSVQELVTGIDLPQRPLNALRERFRAGLARARARSDVVAPLLVIGCDHGARVAALRPQGIASEVITLSVPCSAALPPAFVQYAQQEGAAAMLLADCGEHGCAYRFGARFTRQRLHGSREPYLREHARGFVRCINAGAGEEDALAAAVEQLRNMTSDPKAEPARG